MRARKIAVPRGVSVSNEIKGLTCPTGQNPPIENKAKKPALSNTKNHRRFRPIERHHRAARMLGLALTSGDWPGLFIVFATRLVPSELAAVAFAAIDALPDDCRRSLVQALADAVLGETPPPPKNIMEEASLVAMCSTRDELKATALASFKAMSRKDRAAFLGFVQGVPA
jgi:hypothetical protein